MLVCCQMFGGAESIPIEGPKCLGAFKSALHPPPPRVRKTPFSKLSKKLLNIKSHGLVENCAPYLYRVRYPSFETLLLLDVNILRRARIIQTLSVYDTNGIFRNLFIRIDKYKGISH